MIKKQTSFKQSIIFILVSSIGGFLLSLTGLAIGWIVGTIIMAAILTLRHPTWLKISGSDNRIPPYWLRIGQVILAIELGQKINLATLHIFRENWLLISVMLFLSIIFALLSGFVLWKFSQTDMLTSFFATAPGGVSTMPGIAQEVGANTAIVSIVQTMRIFLVVLTIPIIASTWLAPIVNVTVTSPLSSSIESSGLVISQLLGTVILGLTAWGGYYVGKFLKFPAPWLVGGMVGVAVFQSLYAIITGNNLDAWWPNSIMILSQILIASSIGSNFNRSMFTGIKRTMVIGLLGTMGLIIAMIVCAFLVSNITGISLITAVLAFAPGGIAEMSATAVILHADSTFVVAVQVLRIVVVILVLPMLFRLLKRWELRKKTHSHASA